MDIICRKAEPTKPSKIVSVRNINNEIVTRKSKLIIDQHNPFKKNRIKDDENNECDGEETFRM